MSKPKGLFSIGEIATVCCVSVDTLRFYESKKLIKPEYIAPESGYRYYSRENLMQMNMILRLKDAGLSLLEIRDYMDSGKHADKKIIELTHRRDMLNGLIESLKILDTINGDLTVHEIILPERICICKTIQAKDGNHALLSIGEFYDMQLHNGVPISRSWPEFCEYPDDALLKGEFPVEDFTLTACLPVDKEYASSEVKLFPSGTALNINFRGSYYDLWKAYKALNQYMEQNGFVSSGYPQEIYLEINADGSVHLDEPQNITRVIIPVKHLQEK